MVDLPIIRGRRHSRDALERLAHLHAAGLTDVHPAVSGGVLPPDGALRRLPKVARAVVHQHWRTGGLYVEAVDFVDAQIPSPRGACHRRGSQDSGRPSVQGEQLLSWLKAAGVDSRLFLHRPERVTGGAVKGAGLTVLDNSDVEQVLVLIEPDTSHASVGAAAYTPRQSGEVRVDEEFEMILAEFLHEGGVEPVRSFTELGR